MDESFTKPKEYLLAIQLAHFKTLLMILFLVAFLLAGPAQSISVFGTVSYFEVEMLADINILEQGITNPMVTGINGTGFQPMI